MKLNNAARLGSAAAVTTEVKWFWWLGKELANTGFPNFPELKFPPNVHLISAVR